jgi:hypothetical protein
MPNDAGEVMTERPRSRFPLAMFMKALLIAALFAFLFSPAFSDTHTPPPSGTMRVTLSQKDASFRPIPRAAGGATGAVWYAPTGRALRFQLRAFGLAPARRYVLELQVDDAIYSVASHGSDVRGELAIDTTLTRFEEGVCVGGNYDAPKPALGPHRIKFWIKRDGSPPAGTMPGMAPNAPGAQLRCHGSGDGDYHYVLLENEVADFTGR